MFARMPYMPLGRASPLLVASPYIALLIVLIVWSILSGHFHYCYLPYDSWLTGLTEFYRAPI